MPWLRSSGSTKSRKTDNTVSDNNIDEKIVPQKDDSQSDESNDITDDSDIDSDVEALVDKACEGMDISSDEGEDDSNLFMIDRGGSSKVDTMEEQESDSEFEFPVSIQDNKKKYELSSQLQHEADTSNIYVDLDAYTKPKSSVKLKQRLLQPANNELLKKSVVTPDFEKKHTVPVYRESLHQLKKQRKAARDSSKGKNWFNMQAAEMTESKQNDLMVLQMRKVLDPKHFYKANDLKTTPKFFQMGKIVETSADFYSGRIPKKARKANLVDELLADAEFKKYSKRKYQEIQQIPKSSLRKAHKHMKRLKKQKKAK